MNIVSISVNIMIFKYVQEVFRRVKIIHNVHHRPTDLTEYAALPKQGA